MGNWKMALLTSMMARFRDSCLVGCLFRSVSLRGCWPPSSYLFIAVHGKTRFPARALALVAVCAVTAPVTVLGVTCVPWPGPAEWCRYWQVNIGL